MMGSNVYSNGRGQGKLPDPAETALRATYEAVASDNAAIRDEFRRLSAQEEAQQEGRGVTRRTVVGGAVGAAAALATAEFAVTKAAYAAAPNGSGKTLINIFLAGACDGLGVIAPGDDPVLKAVRPNLLLDRTAIALERGFVLNSAFAPLKPLIDGGRVAFIPAVSDNKLPRSHFQSIDICSLGGLPAETKGTGWLDRLLDNLGPTTAFQAVNIGAQTSRTLVGNHVPLSMTSLKALGVRGDARYHERTLRAIEGLFHGLTHPAGDVIANGMQAVRTAEKLTSTAYKPANGAVYTGAVGTGLQSVAQMLRGDVPVEVINMVFGGYDTHAAEGVNAGGHLYNLLSDLAKGLAAFFTDLGTKAQNTTVIVTTEFGRRVAQNNDGTDHGHGGVAIVVSGRQLAGKVIGGWKGLTELDNGDVPATNNMFGLYGKVAQGVFGLTDDAVKKVFPNNPAVSFSVFA
jgi:uncharacterized protein (DUF1501 family)